jgi:hypothetical protein
MSTTATGLAIWRFADELQALWDTRDGADDPAVIAAIDELIAQNLSDLAVKVDGMYEFLSRSEAESERLGKEAKLLQARKSAIDKRAEYIETKVMEFLKFHELQELKGEFHRLVRRLNPPAVKIVDEGALPARFMTIIPAQFVVNKAEIAKALKAEQSVPGAELTRGERIERK